MGGFASQNLGMGNILIIGLYSVERIMGKYIVRGGRELRGTVKIAGSKNAVLPVLFATLITEGVSRIKGVPDISDVNITLQIIREMGAEVHREDDVLLIDTHRLRYREPREELVCRIRASTYLIGSCLSRFGRVRLGSFGGCSFSSRPIDLHIGVANAFGAVCSSDGLCCRKLGAINHVLPKPSVGATVNFLLLASTADGESRLYGYAAEPHIFTLIDFLRSAGACITVNSDCICVEGGELHGGNVTIPPDMIEAGTFLFAGAMCRGDVRVLGCSFDELDCFLSPLIDAGAAVTVECGTVGLSGLPTRGLDIVAAPYPAFPTDLQPLVAPLLASSSGGRITDTVFPDRFGYLDELGKCGLHFNRLSGGAQIFPSRQGGGVMLARDLRGGAAEVITALAADGVSIVDCAEVVMRGYDSFAEKLSALGASIEYSP